MMSTFTFAISCLITSNLPWFMNLTFQIPTQYCSFLHWNLLSSPDNIPKWASFPLWPRRFFLSGAVCSCPLLFPRSTMDTFQSRGLIFHCHIFLPFIQFMRFSCQVRWSGLPFPPPTDLVLSELSTVTRLHAKVLGKSLSYIGTQ